MMVKFFSYFFTSLCMCVYSQCEIVTTKRRIERAKSLKQEVLAFMSTPLLKQNASINCNGCIKKKRRRRRRRRRRKNDWRSLKWFQYKRRRRKKSRRAAMAVNRSIFFHHLTRQDANLWLSTQELKVCSNRRITTKKLQSLNSFVHTSTVLMIMIIMTKEKTLL
jgi:hypothetical protein